VNELVLNPPQSTPHVLNPRLLKAPSLVLALCLMLLAGCGVPPEEGPKDSFSIDFSLPPDSARRGTLVFFVDGVNATVFEEMLHKGELPAIQKYFVDRGTYVRRGVTNVPSVTLPNLTSFATGQFPGHHNITGINWWDRNRLVWRDYTTIAQKNTLDEDYNVPNIYEQFPDRLTFSVFFQPHRDTTKYYENWTSAGPAFYFGWYKFVDRLTLYRLNEMMDVSRQYKQFPAIAVCYMLAPDFQGYAFGGSSPEYRQALRHTDYQIGRVLGDVQRGGLLDEINIVFITDHGFGDAKTHFDLEGYLAKDLGLAVAAKHRWEREKFEQRLEDYSQDTAMVYGSGDRFFAICLRKPIRKDGRVVDFEPWLTRPGEQVLHYPTAHGDRDLVAELLKLQSMDVVAYPVDTDVVRVANTAGEVEFRQKGGRNATITYHVLKGSDPLGWQKHLSSDALAGKGLSSRAWFDMTAGSDLPDLPAQILAYFRAPRAGDIAAFAKPDYDFRNSNKGGHGGVRPVDMYIPMLIAGPGIPKQTLDHARTVDLFPTILQVQGRTLPANLDGQSLVKKP